MGTAFSRSLLSIAIFNNVLAIAALHADDPAQLNRMERRTLELINRERAKEKLPALKPHPQLIECARSHSRNMAEHGKLTHDLEGDPFDRIAASGYKFTAASENIAAGTTDDPQEVIERWMKSAIHRRNILDRNATETGIGVQEKDGIMFYTQIFANR